MPKLPFYFGQMIESNKLIAFYLLCSGSILGTPQTSKSFKLPPFWLPNSASKLCGWLKQKVTFSREMNHHAVACYAYKADAIEHILSHRFSFSPSPLFLLLSSLLCHSCLELHGH
jgi:hypothetical protein